MLENIGQERRDQIRSVSGINIESFSNSLQKLSV